MRARLEPDEVQPVGDTARRSASLFFGLVFAWSWLWWLAVAMTGGPVTEPPAVALVLLGGLGPPLMAVLLVWRHYPPQGRRRFWRRVWDPRLVGGRWWPIIVAAGAGPTVVGWLVTSGGDLSVGFSPAGASSVGLLPWLVFAAGAGLVEEPGWRGYALDALLNRYKPNRVALLLGMVWALWHVPLFFLEGSYQHGLGWGTGAAWMFLLAIVAQTFLYVWVVTGTGGSILAAVAFHALTNLAGELLDPSLTGRLVALLLWAAAAIVLACTGSTDPPGLSAWVDNRRFAGKGLAGQDPLQAREVGLPGSP